MFDNMNNNNQNFNNGMDPFFNNNVQNNNWLNDNFNYPNFQNNEFNQQFNGYGSEPTNFSNEVNFDNNENLDIPPELSEIKNLNEAAIVNAPTLDVLGPMNIMPENIPQQDPLTNYENGTLNDFNKINEENSPNSVQIDNGFLNSQNFDQSNDYMNSLSIENNIQNSFSLDSSINNNIEKNEQEIVNDSEFNSVLKDNIEENYDKTEIDLMSNNSFSSNETLNKVDIEENNNDFQPIANDDLESKDYVINQEIELKEENDLNKQIDNIYDEVDTLDILDIDEPQLEESLSEEKLTSSKLDIVEEIKKLIDKLKLDGADIDIEEFDLEKMYQLIIKINK